jgi:hypothetical protein
MAYADSTPTLCAASWPAYYGDDTMTEPVDGPPRPADSPALRRAEAALSAAAAAATSTPTEQAPLLADAQVRLAELLAEAPTADSPGTSSQH